MQFVLHKNIWDAVMQYLYSIYEMSELDFSGKNIRLHNAIFVLHVA